MTEGRKEEVYKLTEPSILALSVEITDDSLVCARVQCSALPFSRYEVMN